MLEEEVKNLTPYDKYIILVQDLKDTYHFANGAYQHGQFEIEFKNTEHATYYLDNINTYVNNLKRDYELVLQIKNKVNENKLDSIEKELFISDNELFNKIEELLKKMEEFLSQHNHELSI